MREANRSKNSFLINRRGEARYKKNRSFNQLKEPEERREGKEPQHSLGYVGR